MPNVKLLPLEASDRNQFILDNQEAFNYGALEEFGLRDDHFEDEGEIISRDTIEQSIVSAMIRECISYVEEILREKGKLGDR